MSSPIQVKEEVETFVCGQKTNLRWGIDVGSPDTNLVINLPGGTRLVAVYTGEGYCFDLECVGDKYVGKLFRKEGSDV